MPPVQQRERTLADPCSLAGHGGLSPLKILLIEDSIADAQLLRLLLHADPHVCVTTATRLAKGLAHLRRDHYDLVLLDLSLPDAPGVEAVHRVTYAAREVPIVALSAAQDEELAIAALREGAQDWLVKSEIDRALLRRVVRYACERHRLMAALQSLALMDTLTGLYNRRGFLIIAEEQFKLARRTGHSLGLAFVDLDGMKRINDELGHEFGDRALVATARILKSTFRASDVIARLGGDEFVVLLVAASQTVSHRIRKRLLQALAKHNRIPGSVPVSLSAGFAHFNALTSKHRTLEEVMMEADQAMYIEKQSHHESRTVQERRAREDA
ncbi:MAG: diguanylate cyclase response regulator [Hyphomicrobium sp.]|uniref:diguanylate cyclase response regulator n=1 Tax=Hyphomicrobium sp. TaxID=82 RepID=UPI0025B82AC0|nr:diguanylate cyclase response regulator [Hyphomicrobium sp.]MBZ0211044.1 diguanylate cyclase response regulator [Hyphomicrobium sp.]